MANTYSNSARAASLARRKAQSTAGKAATPRAAKASNASAPTAAPAQPSNSARAASLARRKAQSVSGKAATAGAAKTASAPAAPRPTAQQRPEPAAAPAAAPTASAPARPTRRRAAPVVNANPARAAQMARRKAMSSRGKSAVQGADRTRQAADVKPKTETPAKADKGCGCGCGGKKETAAAATPAPTPTARSSSSADRARKGRVRTNARRAAMKVQQNGSRAASKARRAAMAQRGKSAAPTNGTTTAAQAARSANPNLSSRELAQAVRAQRATKGRTGTKSGGSIGRRRQNKSAPGAAQDAPWKVGVSETSEGQSVTGTMVGRSEDVTGDEASTCRDVTGTEYMGADMFRQFCQDEPPKRVAKVSRSSTSRGSSVTGNDVGRGERVTGNESGTCKSVTGSEYLSAEQMQSYCGTKPEPRASRLTTAETRGGKTVSGDNVGRSERVTGDETGSGRQLTGTQYMKAAASGGAPSKVATSNTLSGGSISGTAVGRSERVTGDEPGTCRNITGDDYVGQEQYKNFCDKAPERTERKVGVSNTLKGQSVSGTMTGRGASVTGDEPGTCKAVTGTPYAGAEQYRSYCEPKKSEEAVARSRVMRSTPAAPMTGIQPSVGGKATGDDKGACTATTGTPYVGADQWAEACTTTAAAPGSSDFPQTLEMAAGDFSVEAPSHASHVEQTLGSVTGTRYEQGRITGPFGMATNKVTGTEEARFGQGKNDVVMPTPSVEELEAAAAAEAKSRVTGEGMAAGGKITGDDWERGDRVTGTEGSSTVGRNPTRRGGMSAMTNAPTKRNEEVPEPVSRVTGGGGAAMDASLVTYSGGARG